MFHPIEFREVNVLLSSDGQNRAEEYSLNPAILIPGILDGNPVGGRFFGDGAIVDGETKWRSADQLIFFFIF